MRRASTFHRKCQRAGKLSSLFNAGRRDGNPTAYPCCAFIASPDLELGQNAAYFSTWYWRNPTWRSPSGPWSCVLPMFVTQSPAPPPEDMALLGQRRASPTGRATSTFWRAVQLGGRHTLETPTFTPIETNNSVKWAAKRAGDTMTPVTGAWS